MFGFILKKIIGTQNERELKKLQPLVDKINSLEDGITKLSDEELRAKTDEFRSRLEKGETLDDILPEAFAVVREIARRRVNMRHFDVQLAGGIILHQGKIAEMATGEGKTLVATLAVYLNALTGKGVHVVTVNDYLAQRDRDWMGPIYEALGLTIGVIKHGIDPETRRQAYQADITYGTNNEFGFDYLRDNMAMDLAEVVQRPHYYAIVDEVDSILIDEARTPLIISGPAEESTDKYYQLDKAIKRLVKGERDEEAKEESGEFIVDEKGKRTYLTEEGEKKLAQVLGIPDMHSMEYMDYRHHAAQALTAHHNYRRDVDYVVKDNEVIIVDDFTGRLMPGRRWSDGLHQAIEAKEGVKIERENQTLATITFQNYFRLYEKLAGMTGTAMTEAGEFSHIYKLECAEMLPNKPLQRTNYTDTIYVTKDEKFEAVVNEIAELNKIGRPVLVGTISIETSEYLGALLKKRNIPHNVLNAKYHEMEAQIVSQAGRFGAVTIATNMAGRGTDILLGGNPKFLANTLIRQKESGGETLTAEEKNAIHAEIAQQLAEEKKKVLAVGGLHIIGTERHESRRIDNQLRGRSGRQGDPGSSRFYIAMEDDLMRLFGSERMMGFLQKLGMEHGQDIQHPLVTRSIETAQKRVESQNFSIRKQILEYDNVMNKQREVIYAERHKALQGEDLKAIALEMIDDIITTAVDKYLPADAPDSSVWDLDGLKSWFRRKFLITIDDVKGDTREDIAAFLYKAAGDSYDEREKKISSDAMRILEKRMMLHEINIKWKDHLRSMDELREGIGLRAYGQRDPLIEYQHEAYQMFMDMIDRIKDDVTTIIFRVEVAEPREADKTNQAAREFIHREISALKQGKDLPPVPRPNVPPTEAVEPFQRKDPKVGRNDPCSCGSGKKYKKCCGRE